MEKREKFSKPILIIFIFFFIWILLQFICPLLFEENYIKNLSGNTILSDNDEIIEEIPFICSILYSSGDKFCHQLSGRSLFINGNQMPFCTRCTAIWLGITIGMGFMLFYKIKLDEKFLILFLTGLIPIGLDGLGQLFGIWESTNLTRLITGLLIGVVAGFAIGLIIDELKTITYFQKKQKIDKKENDV